MMQLLYYLLIKPLSLLPMKGLYILSDVLYLVMRMGLAYRKKVVFQNLKSAFPEKSDTERLKITWRFYQHFCDLIAESIKLFSISEQEAIGRFEVINPEVMNQFAERGKSVLLTGGHYNNWELFAVAIAPQVHHTVLGIYTPITRPFMERKFAQSRSRYGLVLVPKKKVRDTFEKYQDHPTCSVFAIDQCPRKHQKYHWVNFLGIETAAHYGAEHYAKAYNYPIIYGRAKKVKRGHYQLHFELVTAEPEELEAGIITQRLANKLEDQIMEAPEYWLWTHKRWKLRQD